VLKERGAKVLPELEAWAAKIEHTPANEPLLLEALWTYQSLDVVRPKLLAELQHANDYRVRAAATRVASAWRDRLANPLELLAERVADDHPQVRLEAVRALGQVPSARAAELALTALGRPMDRWLDYGLWLTMRELQAQWLPALRQGQFAFGNAHHLVFALQAADSRGVLGPVMDLLRAGKVPADGEEGVLALVATLGGPQELGELLDRAVAGGATPAPNRLHLLAALEQATRQRGVRPAGDVGRVASLLKSPSEPVRAAAARAAGLWKSEAARPQLVEYARAATTSDALRQAAIDGLAALGGKASRDTFEQMTASGPLAERRMALVALVGMDPEAASRRAFDVLSAAPGGEGAAEVFDAFLQQKKGPGLLAPALAGRKLPADVARVGVRTVRTSGREAPDLLEALTRGGGLTFGARTLSGGEMRQMVADATRVGDPARGEAVFRRKDQTCLKCHAIAGAGGQVGPDLSSVGASAPVDYLIESVLEPNKAIKENYHALLVTTESGKLYTGIKVRQTKTELVLRTAEDKEVAIPVKDIEEQAQGRSLMPDGLTDTLTRGELLDLVRFLSELGKVGPYSVGRARVVRRWQVLDPTPEGRQLLRRRGSPLLTSSHPSLRWEPAYSSVAGLLPREDIPGLDVRGATGKGTQKIGVVRCQLDVATAGKVRLRLNSTKGLQLLVGRKPVEVREVTELDLPAGVHTLTFVVDPRERREGLRCELEDQPGSGAEARVVGGK
jgi:putative heme-binding domain-containing protein